MKFILALLLLPLPAFADEWSDADTKREAVYLSIHTIDWLQTRTIAKENWPDGRFERNQILGKHPSVQTLDIHYAITSFGHYYIATLLPTEWRKAWQYIAIGDAGSAIINNYSLGVRIKF